MNRVSGADEYIAQMGALVEKALAEYLDEQSGESENGGQVEQVGRGRQVGQGGHSSRLVEAMRYSLLATSKRIRPVLMIAAAQAVGGEPTTVLPAACALEMIHTYSLIHDDLPAMDNDAFRRGQPTNHRVFGEAAAILAGDALLTNAFSLLADRKRNHSVAPTTLLDAIAAIAEAAGTKGMVGGQMLDILAEGGVAEHERLLEAIHTQKTAMLIAVALRVGGLLVQASTEQLAALQRYGLNIGLTFQITDDILDVEGSAALLGKDVGGDERRGKLTYPALYGIAESRRRRQELITLAIAALSAFDEKAEPLRMLAHYIGGRQK